MTVADYVQFGGYTVAVWAFGYAAGLMFRSVRQVLERAAG